MASTINMKISDYDVLINVNDEDGDGIFRLADESHVGNKRFEVLVNLHRAKFIEAQSNGDDEAMEQIVEMLVDIVCNKCVPRGRFLEKMELDLSSHEGGNEGEEDNIEWMDLGSGPMAKLRVRQALSTLGTHDARRSSKVMEAQAGSASRTGESSSPVNEQDAAIKRRRRGSYARLRRSISESMLFISTADEATRHASSRQSLMEDLKDAALQQEVGDMDVVFNPSSTMLSQNFKNPGNRRFQILIDIHADQFASDDPDSRNTTVRDLINTVQDHWKGHFWFDNHQHVSLLQPTAMQTFNTIESILLTSSKSIFSDTVASSDKILAVSGSSSLRVELEAHGKGQREAANMAGRMALKRSSSAALSVASPAPPPPPMNTSPSLAVELEAFHQYGKSFVDARKRFSEQTVASLPSAPTDFSNETWPMEDGDKGSRGVKSSRSASLVDFHLPVPPELKKVRSQSVQYLKESSQRRKRVSSLGMPQRARSLSAMKQPDDDESATKE